MPITLRNVGAINCGGDGIRIEGADVDAKGLYAYGNKGAGVRVIDAHGSISDVTAVNNIDGGFVLTSSSFQAALEEIRSAHSFSHNFRYELETKLKELASSTPKNRMDRYRSFMALADSHASVFSVAVDFAKSIIGWLS